MNYANLIVYVLLFDFFQEGDSMGHDCFSEQFCRFNVFSRFLCLFFNGGTDMKTLLGA